MNALDDHTLAEKSFAYRDILGQDRWTTWTPVFGSLTIVGAPSYTGRFRIIGRSLQFQVQFSAATSIASAAGTDYLNAPTVIAGLSGIAVMTNSTTKVAVGLCHVEVSSSRIYLPAQLASGNVFNLCGSYEI